MKKLSGCLLWVVLVIAGLWLVACLVVNVASYGKLLPGAGF